MREDHLYQPHRGTGRTSKQLEKILDYIVAKGKKRDIIFFSPSGMPSSYLNQLIYSLLKNHPMLSISDVSHRDRLAIETPNAIYTICFRHAKSLACPSQYHGRDALFVYDHWLYEEAIACLMDDYEQAINPRKKL